MIQAITEHSKDGFDTNMRQISTDLFYLSFLALSSLGFAAEASHEFFSLQRKRDAARKAIRECSTMLDLERLNASVSAKEEGVGEKKKGLTKNAKPKKKKNVEFWNEFVS